MPRLAAWRLTVKQQRFVQEFLLDLNATQAAIFGKAHIPLRSASCSEQQLAAGIVGKRRR
ncbi:terminase small subunit [Bradyrhizobium sp. 190]|uniref:terminase small subunit n=1 Tax=unclassified Bradyrhizobium TaxID=2631580 RepID=UPI001FF71F3C|nr:MULTISPECIES: terminase small subunit [unclassified Bradyrhizobium]MCK1515072.1 terminase small subunit [Bradyrhizobium sp. 190]UPJ54426.1 terminase small subunit [Bradyrhizobium sp. 200]